MEKYPEEMTIVLEHQFWDLEVEENGFEVTLKFAGIPKYIKMPYAAISRFHDPSVGFQLPFDYIETEEAGTSSSSKTNVGATPLSVGESAEVVSLDSFRKK
jgi:hypothetical protein